MIHRVPETGSTSADLLARIAGGDHVPEGEWLIADRQSAGRGRTGRVWSDGSGNFMGSTAVHRRFGDPAMESLALVAGLAVHAAVCAHLPASDTALLKWPNDLMIGLAKLAGILLERSGDSVVLGIGVNLATAPHVPGRDAMALAELGPAPARDAFAEELAAAFDQELDRWRSYGLAPIVRRWLAAAHPIGTPLTVEAGGQTFTGGFAGLDEAGVLQLRLADGETRAIHAGEVRLADQDSDGASPCC
ncbi:MAG: biotin--[acetyl-CoA-carboxylase] ligase [Novosphingobium sp.]